MDVCIDIHITFFSHIVPCESRRDTMKWQNYTSYPRLRDNQIGWYCYWYWNNL